LVAAILLLFVVVIVIAAVLGLCLGVGLALSLHRLGDWGVSGAALRNLGTLVCHAEERINIMNVVGGELL
jgi:NhaP-type Na+/H+ or K+/H+ antiporter